MWIRRRSDPFPIEVRALDALDLAAIAWLRLNGQAVALATYDALMEAAADHLAIPLHAC